MRKPVVSVVVPTIAGREASLERCLSAYRERSVGANLELVVIRDAPTCGEAWIKGAAGTSGDYLHLTADDLEPHKGWWAPLVETCDDDLIPCPVVLNPDGSVQSAGGDLNEGNCLRTQVGADWEMVPFTTVPFLTRGQWERIGMVPLHYFSDVWVSARGGQLGHETVLRTGSVFTHHNEQAGRGAGMGQAARSHHDASRFGRYLAEAA